LSYNWQIVRAGAANPGSQKFVALMNKQTLAENEIFEPETPQPKIVSRTSEDLVLLQDPFSFKQLKFKNNLHYYGPNEPDGVYLKYWCRFHHIARKMHDHSFTKNYTYPMGRPILCEGPSDGVKGGTIVTRINYDLAHLDYFYTTSTSSLQVANMGSGFSIYLDFMMEEVGTSNLPLIHEFGIKPQGFKPLGIKLSGEDPSPIAPHKSMLTMKIDDSSNGYAVRVGLNGELQFFVRRTGTTRDIISPNNKITPYTWNSVCLTYTSADVLGMRINNEPQVDSGSDTFTFPSGHSTRMFHGIGINQNTDRAAMRWRDSRRYIDKIFTSTEMDNIWNNKRSISPTAYGHLSVAGVAHFNANPMTAGYTDIGYTGTGYDVI